MNNLQNKSVLFSEIDQVNFKNWLELDIDGITWEGRYKNEFNNFWNLLFPSQILFGDQLKKLQFAKALTKTGPMVTWFQWLHHKFICYAFVFKELTIYEISIFSNISHSEVALILRDFFVERYPHLEENVNEYFHLGTLTSTNLDMTFKTLCELLNLSSSIRGSSEEDIMTSLEITLYKDWNKLYEDIKSHHSKNEINLDKIKDKATFKKQLRFVRELAFLFFLGGVIILALKFGNKWYEDYLIDKITIFEPNFFWLDKSLSFKGSNPLEDKKLDLNYQELENLEKLESKNIFEFKDEAKRFDGESDVILTSVDALPKDFTAAQLEQSEYEELQKGGYRNSQYGRQKAYRVMISSVEAKEITNKVTQILKSYNVQQADNVRPGTQIPGGYYFNLYVPRNLLKEFLSNVSNMEEAQILESQTRFGGPYGMNKVFIWIKSL